MSELIDSARRRKDLLKHMILQLHKGAAPEAVRTQLVRLMGEVPYGEVVEVEQELIAEGLPQEEVLKFCDMHTAALKGVIDRSAAPAAAPGHPVHTFQAENRALEWEIASLRTLFDELQRLEEGANPAGLLAGVRQHVHAILDVEKHYRRKENLLFPFLEKHGITGPPAVMWGKHDETRALLRAVVEALEGAATAAEARTVTELVFRPATTAVEEMIYKEENILLPMCLDTLSNEEWFDVYRQSPEIGFCLYDPQVAWRPEGVPAATEQREEEGRVILPSGSLSAAELTALLNTIPFDLTFVDREDRVRYFTQGRERIFDRNRAIIGRQVQHCHPPASVHVVQRILDDFRAGREESAPFWIELHGRFIHIEYFALRDPAGNYLGTLEVSQDLTAKRALQGQQRLLSYGEKAQHES